MKGKKQTAKKQSAKNSQQKRQSQKNLIITEKDDILQVI